MARMKNMNLSGAQIKSANTSIAIVEDVQVLEFNVSAYDREYAFRLYKDVRHPDILKTKESIDTIIANIKENGGKLKSSRYKERFYVFIDNQQYTGEQTK